MSWGGNGGPPNYSMPGYGPPNYNYQAYPQQPQQPIAYGQYNPYQQTQPPYQQPQQYTATGPPQGAIVPHFTPSPPTYPYNPNRASDPGAPTYQQPSYPQQPQQQPQQYSSPSPQTSFEGGIPLPPRKSSTGYPLQHHGSNPSIYPGGQPYQASPQQQPQAQTQMYPTSQVVPPGFYSQPSSPYANPGASPYPAPLASNPYPSAPTTPVTFGSSATNQPHITHANSTPIMPQDQGRSSGNPPPALSAESHLRGSFHQYPGNQGQLSPSASYGQLGPAANPQPKGPPPAYAPPPQNLIFNPFSEDERRRAEEARRKTEQEEEAKLIEEVKKISLREKKQSDDRHREEQERIQKQQALIAIEIQQKKNEVADRVRKDTLRENKNLALTKEQEEERFKAALEAKMKQEETRIREEIERRVRAEEEARRKEWEEKEKTRIDSELKKRQEEEVRRKTEEERIWKETNEKFNQQLQEKEKQREEELKAREQLWKLEQDRLLQEREQKMKEEFGEIWKDMEQLAKQQEEEKMRIKRETEEKMTKQFNEKSRLQESTKKRTHEAKLKKQEELNKQAEAAALRRQQEEEEKLKKQNEDNIKLAIENFKTGEAERLKQSLISHFRHDEAERIRKEMEASLQKEIDDKRRKAEEERKQREKGSRWEIEPRTLEMGVRLGKGAFGEVFKAKLHGKEVAVKILTNQDVEEEVLEDFRREVDIMLNLHHPNILLCMGACTKPGHLMIVTELMPKGSVEDLIHNPANPLPLKQRLRFGKECALGINWLHQLTPIFLHLDLKPANLLVDHNWNVKVADFGMSQIKSEGKGAAVGSPFYMAPEILLDKDFDEKADVYSFAVVLWELVTCCEPYQGLFHNFEELTDGVALEGIRPKFPAGMPAKLVDVITRSWNADPTKRPSFETILRESVFDIVSIESIISDPLGRQFWMQYFMEQDVVPWKDFLAAFQQFLGMSDGDLVLDKFRGKSLRIMMTGKAEGERVTIEHFSHTCSWFGPLQKKGTVFVDRITASLKQKWFHGELNKLEAETLLSRQKRGKFLQKTEGFWLVRFSDKPGSFIISVVKPGKSFTVAHHDVTNQNGVFVCTGIRADSLEEVTTKLKTALHLKAPSSGSKYELLFM